MDKNTNRPFLIMAGGTGGHVMPALALADKLQSMGYPVHWLGTSRGIEARLVPQNNIPLHTLTIQGIRGKGMVQKCFAPWRILKAFFQALKVMIQLKPKAVISMGGYVAGPGGLAAWCLRIPLIIHEQNAISGLTNRWLAPFSKKILVAFPETFKSKKMVLTGNPVRTAIYASKKDYATVHPLKILVIGGSLGAHFLNETVPEAINLLDTQNILVWHQTGQAEVEETKNRYLDQAQVQLDAFIEDMPAAYAWADLVICRAGALTIAELCAAGLPSILIPFPFAVDDHQSHNAHYLSEIGAAILKPQSELTPKTLAYLLNEFFKDRKKLQLMSQKSLSKAFPKATEHVAQHCVEVYRGHPNVK